MCKCLFSILTCLIVPHLSLIKIMVKGLPNVVGPF